VNPTEKIELFKSKCVSVFGERLECLVLTGSCARGDFTPSSDIDLWVFIKNLCLEDIQTVGKIVSVIGKPPEINPQCTSFEELKYLSIKDQFEPVQLYVESRVLYGSLPGPAPSKTEIKKYALSVAGFGLMIARHYIASGESEESLAKNKYVKWSLQPLIWAYRCRVFLVTSKYPRSIKDLQYSLSSNEEKEIVKIYTQILTGEFKGPYMKAIEMAEKASKKFILSGN
jgi:predicted nucleotidyltransferase